MNALVKIGTVLAGYVVAVLGANAAVEVRIAHTSGPDAQASAGMYAFGDGLLFIAVFGAAALVPTGLALWFLRPCRWFWVVLSVAALAVAITAIPAAALCVLERLLALPRESVLTVFTALAVLRTIAPRRCLRGRRGPCAQPGVKMGAAGGSGHGGGGGSVRRLPMVRRVLLHLNAV